MEVIAVLLQKPTFCNEIADAGLKVPLLEPLFAETILKTKMKPSLRVHSSSEMRIAKLKLPALLEQRCGDIWDHSQGTISLFLFK